MLGWISDGADHAALDGAEKALANFLAWADRDAEFARLVAIDLAKTFSSVWPRLQLGDIGTLRLLIKELSPELASRIADDMRKVAQDRNRAAAEYWAVSAPMLAGGCLGAASVWLKRRPKTLDRAERILVEHVSTTKVLWRHAGILKEPASEAERKMSL